MCYPLLRLLHGNLIIHWWSTAKQTHIRRLFSLAYFNHILSLFVIFLFLQMLIPICRTIATRCYFIKVSLYKNESSCLGWFHKKPFSFIVAPDRFYLTLALVELWIKIYVHHHFCLYFIYFKTCASILEWFWITTLCKRVSKIRFTTGFKYECERKEINKITFTTLDSLLSFRWKLKFNANMFGLLYLLYANAPQCVLDVDGCRCRCMRIIILTHIKGQDT